MGGRQFAHVVEIAATRGAGEDRAAVLERDGSLVVALADGAGGTGNGAAASQAIVDAVAGVGSDAHDWSDLLQQLDRDGARLGHGQSTAVVVSITASGISGASVGDSGAWLVGGTDIVDLTEGQARKPLVGAGCTPFRIHAGGLAGRTLVVASDGLLRYGKRRDIARIASGADLAAAAQALVDLVRLRSGALQDDVAVVLCREIH
jgi:serine/threonine protein phosphatase PrpC